MKTLTPEELDRLVRREGPACCTILMPSHRAGSETQQDPIRFKNLLQEAHDRLSAAGLSASDVRRRLEPARALLDESGFWRNQDNGLAVFLGDGDCETYGVALALAPLVVVGRRFYLKPLYALAADGHPFYVLAFSPNAHRLLRCDARACEPVGLPGVPDSLDELMRVYAPQEQLRPHAAGGSPRPSGGTRRAMLHDQAIGVDDRVRKHRIAEFCHAVAGGVHRVLAVGDAPLVLAAAEPALSILRSEIHYAGLWSEAIGGNPDRVAAHDLRERARELLRETVSERRRRDVALYEQSRQTPRASCDTRDVVRAAHNNQVAVLFVDLDSHRWGRFDPATFEVDLHDQRQPGDEELTNLAAARTWIAGGTVHALPHDAMPDDAPLAALYRFATES